MPLVFHARVCTWITRGYNQWYDVHVGVVYGVVQKNARNGTVEQDYEVFRFPWAWSQGSFHWHLHVRTLPRLPDLHHYLSRTPAWKHCGSQNNTNQTVIYVINRLLFILKNRQSREVGALNGSYPPVQWCFGDSISMFGRWSLGVPLGWLQIVPSRWGRIWWSPLAGLNPHAGRPATAHGVLGIATLQSFAVLSHGSTRFPTIPLHYWGSKTKLVAGLIDSVTGK